ncbi:MAG: hypothetical protein AUJ96_29105 [Armatimonadetes bacterium CG2_30_66_41]|nr:MAG: hypothetical protein AUJ96_29105 [Armatimonadetes bacterium CG2_30_66_41]PIU94453.1 MAG: hypothetical protein COS65_07510 [Armatimonadetes bacterium CG06_land_8_20_14_3_00_66_21]PIX46994.1 MAG: hypothetical protein COZ57_09665 [Armatimonadetes bacterium CG_4_8_14_3_um_filter_66_20]
MQKMNAALGYVRVSDKEQVETDLSLPRQRRLIEGTAGRRDYYIVEWFEDAGRSAFHDKPEDLAELTRRLGLRAAIARAKRDKLPIWVMRLDRFSRSTDAPVMIELLRSVGSDVFSVTEQIDTSRAEGVLLERILQTFAWFRSAQLGPAIADARKTRAERGLWTGDPPSGYVVAEGKLRFDPKLKPIVQQVLTLGMEGFGCHVIAGRLSPEYQRVTGNYLHASLVFRILRNPAYCGRLSMKGTTVEGALPKLVEPWEFERLQEQLSRRRRSPKAEHELLLLQGIATCGKCGKLLRRHVTRSEPYLTRSYLCPTHRTPSTHSEPCQVMVSERKLHRRLRQDLEGLLGVSDRKVSVPVPKVEDGSEVDRKAEVDRLKRQRGRLLEAYKAEAISVEELKRERQAVDKELERLSQKARERKPTPPNETTLRRVAKLVLEALTDETMDPARRRAVIGEVFREVRVQRGADRGVELTLVLR